MGSWGRGKVEEEAGVRWRRGGGGKDGGRNKMEGL